MPWREQDTIFASCQMLEKCGGRQKLHLVFIDPENVYDGVPREEV